MSNPKWTFFSNHGHVYFLIALRDGEITVREIAQKVGITERTVQGIIQDLEEGDYIEKQKQGRSNLYKVVSGKTLRHSLEKNIQLNELTEIIRRGQGK